MSERIDSIKTAIKKNKTLFKFLQKFRTLASRLTNSVRFKWTKQN